MTFSISSLTLYVASILLTSSSWLHLTEADLISTVCKDTVNQALCNKVLRSDPRSRGANLVGLGQISIDYSASAANAAILVAGAVATPGNKPRIDSCVSSLNKAVNSINQCRGALNNGGTGRFVRDAISEVTDCDDTFVEGTIPGKLKDALNYATENLSVLLSISDALRK